MFLLPQSQFHQSALLKFWQMNGSFLLKILRALLLKVSVHLHRFHLV
jgi:hypothetical protein